MPQFTTEDLIQYLYRETTAARTEAIEKAIEGDSLLSEKFKALKESTDALDELLESPRPQSVMAILNYAKRTSPLIQQ